MSAPPTAVADKEAMKKAKEAKAKAEKMKAQEKQKWAKFRVEMEQKVSGFVKDTSKKNFQFSPMDLIGRSIVHDIAEVAGLASFSFGEENVDRYLMLWKKEFAPSDAELEARRNGEEWNEEKEKRLAAIMKEKANEDILLETERTKSRKRNHSKEPEKYFDKYAKILGGESGVDAAKATRTNASYGMVPSKNKEDQRSIEETMNQLRERKKQRNNEKDKATHT